MTGAKMGFGQFQRQELRQSLSAQQIQYVAVLQMTVLELQAYLSEMQLENPLLEVELPEAPQIDRVEMMRWLISHPTDRREDDPGDENTPFERRCPDGERSDLAEYLKCQFDLSLGDRELALLCQLVCSLDDAGYLRIDEARLVRMGYEKEEIREAVAYLQSLDPPGIGALDLGHCLMIQLRRKGLDCPEAHELVSHHLEDLARGRFGKAAAALHVSAERIQELYRVIRTLDPKPGSPFGKEAVRTIIPDMLVTRRDGELVCLPHVHSQPRVVINRDYLNIAQGDESARDYVNKKLSQAVWLTRLIAGRQETVGRIGDFLLLRQREFFESLEGRLHPLRLREAAEHLGVHESTVSRAVSGKYLQCDKGVYPLKYFFCGGAGDVDAPETVGSRSVKEYIRALIEAEDKKHPLSDAAISSLLAGEGIALARRTVAKYREELMIAAAVMRKT